MKSYLVLDGEPRCAGAYGYASDADKRALFAVQPDVANASLLAEFLLCTADQYRLERSRYKNYAYLLRYRTYAEVTVPTVGLRPEAGKESAALTPAGEPIDYIQMGGPYCFISPRLKHLLDTYGVKSICWDAFIELDGRPRSKCYLWCPLVALDALDAERSVFTRDVDDESVLTGIRPAHIDSIDKLVLNETALAQQEPLFILGFTRMFIPLVREDLATAIREAGMTGLEFKRIEDCKWDR